jgi:Spherulation-specific family 4
MRELSSNRTLRLLLLGSLLLVVLGPVASSTHAAQSANPGGLIVPLYFYPNSSWQTLISIKLAHPAMPVIAVVNPGNGPGSSYDPNYGKWIHKLRAAGIVVVGYVQTQYAARSLGSDENDISTYKQWYAVNGIFLDQMSNVQGEESYYSNLTNYAKSYGLSTVVGNPGTDVPASYLGTVSILLIYENAGLPTASRLAYCTMGYTRDDFAMVSYGDVLPSQSTVDSITHYVRYVYITSGVMPSPYSSFPSYLSSLVFLLNTS